MRISPPPPIAAVPAAGRTRPRAAPPTRDRMAATADAMTVNQSRCHDPLGELRGKLGDSRPFGLDRDTRSSPASMVPGMGGAPKKAPVGCPRRSGTLYWKQFHHKPA